jgi:hypothetical protein
MYRDWKERELCGVWVIKEIEGKCNGLVWGCTKIGRK